MSLTNEEFTNPLLARDASKHSISEALQGPGYENVQVGEIYLGPVSLNAKDSEALIHAGRA